MILFFDRFDAVSGNVRALDVARSEKPGRTERELRSGACPLKRPA